MSNPATTALGSGQARTGPIIVGAKISTATVVPTKTVAAAAAAVATTATNKNANKPHLEGRYANASLSILGAYASSSVKNERKRKSECIDVLSSTLPALDLCSNNSISTDYSQDEEIDRSRQISSKEMRPNTGNSKHDSGIDNSKVIYHKQLEKELQKYKQQNQILMKRRNNVLKSMVALHEMYETGLDYISRINDLRFIPDNVMPDEIPR